MLGPNVFTDRDSDFRHAQEQRLDTMRRFEVAIFIEDIVGRQERFVSFGNGPACLEQGGGVMERFPAPPIAFDVTD